MCGAPCGHGSPSSSLTSTATSSPTLGRSHFRSIGVPGSRRRSARRHRSSRCDAWARAGRCRLRIRIGPNMREISTITRRNVWVAQSTHFQPARRLTRGWLTVALFSKRTPFDVTTTPSSRSNFSQSSSRNPSHGELFGTYMARRVRPIPRPRTTSSPGVMPATNPNGMVLRKSSASSAPRPARRRESSRTRKARPPAQRA
jgi:hypothetical protein